MNFELALTEAKVKPHQVTTLHLLVAFTLMGGGAIAIVAHVYSGFLNQIFHNAAQWLGSALVACGLILLVAVISFNKKLLQPEVNNKLRLVEFLVIGCLSVLLLFVQWKIAAGVFGVLAACLAFAMYWERTGQKKLSVELNKDGIKLPVTSRRRHLAWRDVESVLLRFGVLTIDCVDNYLFQWDVAGASFSKEEFESWCSEQVELNKNKRIKDW
jgi:hypothetical protein